MKPVPYKFDRDNQVIDLFKRASFSGEMDQKYFDWKYKGYSDEHAFFPNAWIIEDGNKIVAFNGYLQRTIIAGGKKYWAVQSFDTVTDPDYRGRGLFGLLQNHVYEEIKKHNITWLYGWTSEIGFKVFTKKMAWAIWSRQRFLMKVLDTDLFVQQKIHNPILGKLIYPFFKAWSDVTKPSVSKKYKTYWAKELPDSSLGLIEKHNKMFSMSCVKTLEYINWRAANPICETKFLILVTQHNDVPGYAAVTKRDNNYDIDDIMVENSHALRSLLAGIESDARKNKAYLIRFRVNYPHKWARVFKQAGYFWSRTEFPVLGRKLINNDFQTITENLHWTLFDRNE